MRQAIMTQPGHIEFNDVPEPAPGPGEILLRIKKIGVCGSDGGGVDPLDRALRGAGRDERSAQYARQWIRYMDSEIERQNSLADDT